MVLNRHFHLNVPGKKTDAGREFEYWPPEFPHAAYDPRVDVTEEFPFLVTKLSPYYDR